MRKVVVCELLSLFEQVPTTSLESIRASMSPTGHQLLDYRVVHQTS